MSRRTPPLEWVGSVALFRPTGTGTGGQYYRLRWVEPDGRPADTTGGRDLDGARAKARGIADRLERAASPYAVATLEELVNEFLREGRSPYTDAPVSASYAQQLGDNLSRCIRGFEDYRAMDVTRALCDAMRAQAGTANMVRVNTTALRAWLLWGYRHPSAYFTADQADLLPHGVVMPRPALLGTAMPDRRPTGRQVGEDELYIREEDAPSKRQVRCLGKALAQWFPAWGRLAPELAANCGPRWGEQFQLTAEDVHLSGCKHYAQPHIHLDWQIDSGASAGQSRRRRPKGDKTRIAPVPEVSFTGYPLLRRLRQRVKAARQERRDGTNPQALLFPATEGGLWWQSGFSADLLLPAMGEAGWPLQSWTERRAVWSPGERRYHDVELQRTTAVLTWHSLRHRFARVAIDLYGCGPGELMALGGWEDEATVSRRYYKTGHEHTVRALNRFSPRPGQDATRKRR
jgi:hypothetical protein